MEDIESFPTEGPEHFEGFLRNIKESTATKDALWWYHIDKFGIELNHSREAGKVSKAQAEEFIKKIEEFMSQGTNRKEYREKLGDEASFWWEETPEENNP